MRRITLERQKQKIAAANASEEANGSRSRRAKERRLTTRSNSPHALLSVEGQRLFILSAHCRQHLAYAGSLTSYAPCLENGRESHDTGVSAMEVDTVSRSEGNLASQTTSRGSEEVYADRCATAPARKRTKRTAQHTAQHSPGTHSAEAAYP